MTLCWCLQTARNTAVSRFRAGKVSLLVVTDVAARGIDIPLLDNVVHFDFPSKPKLFVHRSGRAARMGRSGTSYALLTKDEVRFLLPALSTEFYWYPRAR